MASGNMKDIKRRIKSVQSTMQITKAMELVASSKMRHAKERALGARPYFTEVRLYANAAAFSEEICTNLADDGVKIYPYEDVYSYVQTISEDKKILLSKDSGCIPSYKRTKLTDALHSAFGFRTDYEFISKADIRALIKETMQKK